MAATQAQAWLEQAASDLRSAQILWATAQADAAQPSRTETQRHSNLYCQVVAKCQQVVEKGVRAIVAELNERGLVRQTIGYSHSIEGYITAIRRAPPKHKDALDYIRNGLDDNRSGISDIMRLAPHKPENPARPQKNTEYPYLGASQEWTAPASLASFRYDEVERFYRVAGVILKLAENSVRVTSRKP